MKPVCPRQFEAEAWRDGRLSGAEVARFEAHASVCAGCARELRSLQALGAALRSPALPADELHVRRERTRLLAAFDASLVPAPRGGRWLAPVAVLLVACAAALVFWRSRPAPAVPGMARKAPPAAVGVRADSAAQWSRRVESQVERVTLQSGTLSIRVDHAVSHRRLLVVLPDGELEDIGTTFSISADGAHTTHVSVQEGSVVLRLNGKPPLALGAGESWSPAPAAPPVVASAVAPRAGPSAKLVSPAARVSGLESAPSAEFRAAMSALNGGQHAQAAALFAAFLNEHPRDARAEDAAYLRVLALQRAGESASMKRAASEYLKRYPRGFRQAEVEPLAH